MLADAWTYVIDHPGQFWKALAAHLSISVAALTVAALIAVPAGIHFAHRPRTALAAVNLAPGDVYAALQQPAVAQPVETHCMKHALHHQARVFVNQDGQGCFPPNLAVVFRQPKTWRFFASSRPCGKDRAQNPRLDPKTLRITNVWTP